MNKDIFVAAFEKKLYHYSHKEETLQNISERLEYIESELTNVGSSNPTSYSSGSSDYNVVENKRLNLLSEQIALSQQLKKVEYEYLEIKKPIIVLDSSVLLDLYEYAPEVTKSVLAVLEVKDVKTNLWIPAQVLEEFENG